MFTPSAKAPTLRVGIYRASSIGDVVLASSCLSLLEGLEVPTEVFWIGRQPSLGLIVDSYPAIEGLEVDDKTHVPDLLAKLSKLHFLVDLQTNLRSWYICYQLKKVYGVPVYSCHKQAIRRGGLTIGARLRGRKKALPPSISQCVRRQFELMSECLVRALEIHLPVEMRDSINHITPVPQLPFQRPRDVEDAWQKEMKFGVWIALAPGAAHQSKQVPIDVLAEIFARLKIKAEKDNKHWGLVFLGTESDRDLTLKISDRINWPYPILNLTGKLSLSEASVALRLVKCVLTNDSALSHIAEAVETPSIVMFGPTVESFGFAPWRSSSKSFSAPLGCRPCSKHGEAKCRFDDFLCFRMLPIHEIVNHTVSLLGEVKS